MRLQQLQILYAISRDISTDWSLNCLATSESDITR